MKGFTLIELIVAMAILGLIAGLISYAADMDDNEVTVVEDNLTTRISGALEKGSYRDVTYWNEVVVDASAEYTPVCVHGTPYFITKRGPQAGTLTPAHDPRGHRQNQKFWAACSQIGIDLHEEATR